MQAKHVRDTNLKSKKNIPYWNRSENVVWRKRLKNQKDQERFIGKKFLIINGEEKNNDEKNKEIAETNRQLTQLDFTYF